ncbi:MAG: pentapeptide repeat-containing protein [Bacteroidota bacterium]
MKLKGALWLGLLAGICIGYALGYLRLPDISNAEAFWVGALSCIAAGSFGLAVFRLWKGKKTSFPNRSLLISVLVVSSLWLVAWVLLRYSQAEAMALRKQYQRSFIKAETSSSVHISELLPLMNQLLAELQDDLDKNPKRIPGGKIRNRLWNLSIALKPYRLWQGDTLSTRSFSPERAQLLINLANMRIDSNAFLRIKQEFDFTQADLRGMNLSGLDLRGASLQAADFTDASLIGTRLDGADLRDANLWGTKLLRTSFRKARMQRANLAWAELDGAVLDSADLSGIQAASSKWRHSQAIGADLKWSDLSTANVSQANFQAAYLLGADLHQSNLRQADLTDAYIDRANLEDADLIGAKLDRAVVNEWDWPDKLIQRRVNGAETLRQQYKVVANERVKTKKSLIRISVDTTRSESGQP